MAVITHDESAPMFFWKGEIPEQYCDCILNPLIQPQDYGKVHRPDLIVDYRVGMNLLVHQGKNTEDLLLKDDTIPDPIST